MGNRARHSDITDVRTQGRLFFYIRKHCEIRNVIPNNLREVISKEHIYGTDDAVATHNIQINWITFLHGDILIENIAHPACHWL